jgi:hypothetical protein
VHRIAIRDPQRIRHQPFAELRIRMVDGDPVRRQFYSRSNGSFGLIGHGDCRCFDVWKRVHVDISSGTRMARGKGSAQAIIRCGRASAIFNDGVFGLRSRR